MKWRDVGDGQQQTKHRGFLITVWKGETCWEFIAVRGSHYLSVGGDCKTLAKAKGSAVALVDAIAEVAKGVA